MKRSLQVEDKEMLQSVLGLYDGNIKRIRKATGTRITFRKGKICIEGEEENVARAHKILTRLFDTARARGEVTEEDVDAVMAPKPDPETMSLETAVPGRVFRHRDGVTPQSEGQERYVREMEENEIVFAIGPAGTGKTFLAVARAVQALRSGEVRRMVLVRPAVEAGERLGFLPGDIQAKVNPYLRPIYDSLNSFLEFGQLTRLVQSDVIEICPLAYMRGRTLDEAFIILDEAQNTTGDQMKMFLTRMGRRSHIVVTGDVTQTDLPPGKMSGLVEAERLLKGIPGLAFSMLDRADIVRHPLVQRVVDAYEKGHKGKRRG